MAARRKSRSSGVQWARISGYLFLFGIVISVVAGVLPGTIPYTALVLVGLGVIVGILSAFGLSTIAQGELDTFVIAAIALMVSGVGTQGFLRIDEVVSPVGTYLASIVGNISAFVAPAVVIIALEAIWRVGSAR